MRHVVIVLAIALFVGFAAVGIYKFVGPGLCRTLVGDR
jgi:hypothetical protein